MAKKTYGSRGQEWHPAFVKFVEEMVKHPSYANMPDAYTDDGRVQWEAPSNRKSGKFKDTNRKRLDWWRRTARSLGIGTDTEKWRSKTAKALHPTMRKPCRRCGRVLELAYVYPTKGLVKRILKIPGVAPDFEVDRLEAVDSLVQTLVNNFGDTVLDALPKVFKTGAIDPPAIGRDLERWLRWLRAEYIPQEPRLLSPGAMANPPDRFDGFHHFNLCCRGKADTGRHSANLSSYVTDRRAFEFWNDGDWIAADRLMGVIRATMAKDPCLKGHAGPCQADHTGPLSLGFAHRPEFQLLCPPCNGAKNNRLSLRDVRSLIASEEKGESVISWHSHTAWAARKHVVHDDETALRMTKILRDNRRTTMATLSKIADRGHYVFLARLLHLAAADSEVEINQVENDSGTVRAIDISRHARVSKYAVEQKARRLRIAFESLLAYSSKKNRNAYVISTPDSEGEIEKALDLLDASSAATHKLNRSLKTALHAKSDLQLRELAPRLTDYDDPVFVRAFKHLQAAIDSVGGELASRWDDERYVRAEQDEDI